MLTCIVAASTDRRLARRVQGLFAQSSMRITLSADVRGVEICGALKNVLAIAAGTVEGQGLGSNALAAVVRPLAVLSRLSLQRSGFRAFTRNPPSMCRQV